MDRSLIAFSEKHNTGDMRLITINGLVFPGHAHIDPLGKLWGGGIRNRIFERYHVDIVGLFSYDNECQSVTCNFILNFGILDDSEMDVKTYTKLFEDTFSQWGELFEEMVLRFVEAKENGYNDYLILIEEYHREKNEGAEDDSMALKAISKTIDTAIKDFLVSQKMRFPNRKGKDHPRNRKKKQ